ncbi:hypothetical protein MKX01_007209 [Papaver californicum]|nr:hypothetical protein MKX01_007209 [Papaver californicum]
MGIENINVFESDSNADLISNSEDAMSPPPTTPGSSVSNSHLIPKVKGHLDNMFAPDFDKLVQKPIDNIHRKVARENTCEFVCDFFYENGLSFNVMNSPSFIKMLVAVGQFGPDFKGPTYHELRVSFLKKKVLAIGEWIDEFKVHWKNYGCSIMCDWWTDGRIRTLINFLVNCPKGTVFLKSIDGSTHIKTAKFCHEMLVDVLAEVGHENLIQDLDLFLKVYKPLVNLIRMVDTEEKPAMGHIYHAVDQMMKQIPLMLKCWAEQLHQPLHAAGYYLNPSIYFSNPPESGESLDGNADVKKGLYDDVAMLFKDEETQDKVINQLLVYQSAAGLMGQRAAIRNMTATSPVEWWINWGSEVPELQHFTKRVLGLTVSASSCERNWSAFNNINHQKLNDLVFVSYNTKLRACYLDRTNGPGKDIDPLFVKDYEAACAEWIAPFSAESADDECLDGEVCEDDETSVEDGAHTTTRQYKKNTATKRRKNPAKTRGVNELYNSDLLGEGETISSMLKRRKRKAVELQESSDSLDESLTVSGKS